MEVRSVEAVVRALNEAGVRYLVAGGLAVVAHGYLRFTHDIDIVLALDDANARRAIAALEDLGDHPSVPVSLRDFADPENRKRWAAEEDATVFPLNSDFHRLIQMKEAVGRPQDLADIDQLRRIRDFERDGGPSR